MPNLKALSNQIAADIDRYCEAELNDGRRSHLGASEIGDNCSRKLWYKFRWCGAENTFDGRMLRLFSRGHDEEPRFVRYLKGIGATVYTVDSTGNQFRFSAHNGHFGGSIDGVAELPTGYNLTAPVLTEFKTQGTGRGFTDLTNKGVKLAKPQHYAQMCVYGIKFNLTTALYMAVNKNDDSLHIELVKLDNEFGEELCKKAARIVASQETPPKLSESPAFFACKYCEFNEICHYEAPPVKNCRSCTSCVPVTHGNWECRLHGAIVPKDYLPTGCDYWKAIV